MLKILRLLKDFYGFPEIFLMQLFLDMLNLLSTKGESFVPHSVDFITKWIFFIKMLKFSGFLRVFQKLSIRVIFTYLSYKGHVVNRLCLNKT